MKKTYSKPNIVFESFSLCTSIAVGCLIVAPGEKVGTGGVQAGPFVVFQNETQGCVMLIENGYLNGFCYHNPADYNNLYYS